MKTYKADLAKDFGEDPRNANKGTKRGRKMLNRSASDLGAGRSIVVDKNGLVIAGNKTRQAMVETGISDALVVESDGTELVVVKRIDLDLTDVKGRARALAYADNRVGEIDYELNDFILREDLANGIVPDWLELDDGISNSPNEDDESNEIYGLNFKIVINCLTEEAQQSLLTELESRGLDCKVVIV